jgi:hypothetical protein
MGEGTLPMELTHQQGFVTGLIEWQLLIEQDRDLPGKTRESSATFLACLAMELDGVLEEILETVIGQSSSMTLRLVMKFDAHSLVRAFRTWPILVGFVTQIKTS